MSERVRRLVEAAPDTRVARAQARKVLREAINGEHLLLSIGDILETFMRGAEKVPDSTGAVDMVPLDSERISALKAALDGHFKLLGKVLPDLKAVELTGADGDPLLPAGREVSNTELAARMLFLLRTAGDVVEGEVEEPESSDERSLDFLD